MLIINNKNIYIKPLDKKYFNKYTEKSKNRTIDKETN